MTSFDTGSHLPVSNSRARHLGDGPVVVEALGIPKLAATVETMDHTTLIHAAAKHWNALAAFAWTSGQKGHGAVVVHCEDLIAEAVPAMNWFAAADVPPGDDFRTLMVQSDAHHDVVLVVVTAEEDIAMVLSASDGRPSPEACAKEACGES